MHFYDKSERNENHNQLFTLNIKMLEGNVGGYRIKIIVETLRRSRWGSGEDDDDDGNEMDGEDHTDTETETTLVLEYGFDNLIIRMGGVGRRWNPLVLGPPIFRVYLKTGLKLWKCSVWDK